MKCLRCESDMEMVGNQKIQLGESGVLSGIWSNIFSGALSVNIYICTKCNNIDFFLNKGINDDLIAQIECIYCNKLHDLDDSKCPYCNKRLQN